MNIKTSLLKTNTGQIEGLPKNPRVIKDAKYNLLKKSIEENPEMLSLRELLVYPHDGSYILIGGNMRLKACKELGYKEIPCKVIPEETDIETLKAYVIKDNANFGEWDYDMLANEWESEDLNNWGLDVWKDEEKEPEIIEDEAPEVDEENEPIAKLGDIWQLGRHRLMCGDSTDPEQVARLMNGVKADMVFTDPPYGIDYSGGRTQVVSDKDYGKLKNDDLQGQELGNLISQVFLHNKAEADVYICVSPIMQKPFLDNIESQGKIINAVIVWDKKQPGLGYMAYRRQCEFILFCKGKPFKKGDTSDFDLWSISRDSGQDYVHGTQKPVAVSARAIKNSSKAEDNVLDFFGGSGSTLIACEHLNRVCYMSELDPKYIDVIIKRYENLTGDTAVLLENIITL